MGKEKDFLVREVDSESRAIQILQWWHDLRDS